MNPGNLDSSIEAQDGILRVADFLNYRVDPVLMDECGAILANKLSKRKVTKVLAGCSSVLAPGEVRGAMRHGHHGPKPTVEAAGTKVRGSFQH